MKVTLSSGREIEITPGNIDEITQALVKEVLIPFYEQNNDWPAAIEKCLQEAKEIFKQATIDQADSGMLILQAIEKATGREIAELTGKVNTVEILFADVEDYMQDIDKMVTSGWSEEKVRIEIANQIEELTRFEIVELLLALARKARQ